MDNEDGRNSGTTQTPHFANLPVASLPAPAGWNCFVHGPVGIFLVRSDRVIAPVGRGLAWMTNVQWYQMRARPLGCRDGKFTPPQTSPTPGYSYSRQPSLCGCGSTHLEYTLPTDVVAASSLSTFRRLLKRFLFKQSYPDITY